MRKFKIKKFTYGTARNIKSMFFVRGNNQIYGVDYFDTYAPVVQCSTVYIIIVL